MALQYWTINSSAGVNKDNQPHTIGMNQFRVCQNFEAMHDYQGVKDIGFCYKSPAMANWKGTMPAAGRSRGLWHYIPTIPDYATKSFVLAKQCTTDYTASRLYALDVPNNTWYTLVTDAVASYHADATQYLDRIYIAMGNITSVVKWNGDTTNWGTTAPILKDKGGTWTNIAGATLTWNGTTTVTSNISVAALVYPGDYIRRSSTSVYADEVKSVNTGGDGKTITLISASSDNGASGAGTAQKAPNFAYAVFFAHAWKNKLWLFGNGGTLYWSASGDPEDYSTINGGGSLIVCETYDDYGSGIASLGDYLFLFNDLDYYVYGWTGDLDVPITLVRQVDTGCVSKRTIQQVLDGLIYFTGNDVRWTNGSQDVSIADGQLRSYFEQNPTTRHYMFYTILATSNLMPWAIVDKRRHIYKLVFPSSTGNATAWNYDYRKKIWTHEENYFNGGHGDLVWGSSAQPTVVFSKSTSSNQLQEMNMTDSDLTTAGVLESATLTTPNTNQKLKVAWVEIGFHPALGCDSDITFNYYKDYQEIDTSKAQPYNLVWAATETNTDKLTIKRFPVNETCNFFSWYLSVADGGGTDSLGIVYVTTAYEVME